MDEVRPVDCTTPLSQLGGHMLEEANLTTCVVTTDAQGMGVQGTGVLGMIDVMTDGKE